MSTAAASPQANLAGHFAPDLFRDDGLICGYRFAPGQGGQELPSARHGLELLPGLEGSFVWLHFNLSHAGAQRWLRENLPPGMRFLEEIDGKL